MHEGVVVVHILGVVFHTLRHRENIVASMIHGKKNAEPSDAIASATPIIATLFLVIVGAWTVVLFGSYNPATQTITLPLIGSALQLGESDTEGGTKQPGESTEPEEH